MSRSQQHYCNNTIKRSQSLLFCLTTKGLLVSLGLITCFFIKMSFSAASSIPNFAEKCQNILSKTFTCIPHITNSQEKVIDTLLPL